MADKSAIEVTVEMLDAFGRARSRAYGEPINTHSWDEAGLAAALAIVERQWQAALADAYRRGFLKGQHRLCPRCGVELARDVAEEMAAIPREDCPYCSRGAECRWRHAEPDGAP